MSFGFSPGDIGFLIGFGKKVFTALKESKADFQIATQQCLGFLQVMDTMQRLDLSRMPANIKLQIEQQSEGTKYFVSTFKERIQKYEKGLGESSGRGAVASAPRKLQWAFDAAEDLDKFRQSMQAQLGMVVLLLQMGFWATATGQGAGNAGHATLPSSLDVRRTASADQQMLSSHSASSGQLLLADHVDDLTDIIYERLLTRPRLPLSEERRIFTLPNDENELLWQATAPSSPGITSSPVMRPDDTLRLTHAPSSHAEHCQTHEDGQPLSDSINDHLQALQLPGLTTAEAEQVDRPAIIDSDGVGDPRPSRTDNDYTRANTSQARRKRRFRNPLGSLSGVEPLTAIGIASSVLQVIDMASQVSFMYSDVARSIRSASFEMNMLAGRIMEYSALLQPIAEIMLRSGSSAKVGHGNTVDPRVD